MKVFIAWLLLGASCLGAAYPLKLSSGNHYVVDASGTPFFIHGDSAWTLAKYLSASDVDYYLSNRWVQGFNSIIVDACPIYTNAAGSATLSIDPHNYYGELPFTNTIAGPYTNLNGYNEKYWTNVDAIINKAGSYGMCVFLFPFYDGCTGCNEGWYDQGVGNGTNRLYQYGQFIGNRYKNFTNIVYLGAGDLSEPNGPNFQWNWVGNGILSVDTNHLISAQAGPSGWDPNGGESALPYYAGGGWCNLNCSYARMPTASPSITYNFAITNYWYSPTTASFSREPFYESTPYSTSNKALDCRRYEWGSVTYGEVGAFYGNAYIATYNFDPTWKTHLFDAGTTVSNAYYLLSVRQWWKLVPDTNNTAVSAGFGTYGQTNYVTTSLSSDKLLMVSYFPNSATITVQLTNFPNTVTARWYDPTTGAFSAISGSPFANTGTHNFTPTGNNAAGDPDWVLLMESATTNTFTLGGLPTVKGVTFQ